MKSIFKLTKDQHAQPENATINQTVKKIIPPKKISVRLSKSLEAVTCKYSIPKNEYHLIGDPNVFKWPISQVINRKQTKMTASCKDLLNTLPKNTYFLIECINECFPIVGSPTKHVKMIKHVFLQKMVLKDMDNLPNLSRLMDNYEKRSMRQIPICSPPHDQLRITMSKDKILSVLNVDNEEKNLSIGSTQKKLRTFFNQNKTSKTGKYFENQINWSDSISKMIPKENNNKTERFRRDLLKPVQKICFPWLKKSKQSKTVKRESEKKL